MLKHPCSSTACHFPCEAKMFYLQQIQAQGQVKKHGCPYTIYTSCGTVFSNLYAIDHLEVCADADCTLLPGCKNETLIRVRIPLTIHFCTCSSTATEKGYIEEVIPLRFCGNNHDIESCRTLVNACVRLNKKACACPTSACLDVSIQVYMVCGCVVQAAAPCFPPCPEQKPWYPPPCHGHLR